MIVYIYIYIYSGNRKGGVGQSGVVFSWKVHFFRDQKDAARPALESDIISCRR